MNTPLTPDDPRLTACALGELPPAEQAGVQAALTHSPECQAAFDDIRQTASALASALAAEPCPVWTQAQKDALLAAEPSPRPAPARRPVAPGFWALWGRRLAWAAAATSVAALVWMLQPTPPTQPPVPRHTAVKIEQAPSFTTPPAPSTPLGSPPPPLPPVAPAMETTIVAEVSVAPSPLATRSLLTHVVIATNAPATNLPPATPPPQQAVQAPPPPSPLSAEPRPILPNLAPPRAAELAVLRLQLPAPAFKGTPTDPPPDTTAERPKGPRPPFYAPKGVLNLARGQKVTSSDLAPITGSLDLITDGNKEATDTSTVELHRRTQWVQIDLGKEVPVYAIVIWHNHNTPCIYRDVIVRLSSDPDFAAGVTTLFNNDQDNSSGLGVGTDREYFETNEGKLVDAKGTKARYVRCSSKGSTDSALNVYTEIEVYALPIATPTPTPSPAALPEGTGDQTQLAPLPLKLPAPAFRSIPVEPPPGTTALPLNGGPRPRFYAPRGVRNMALGRKVRSSDLSPITGPLSRLTDGDKECSDTNLVELHRRTQWVQVDLEQPVPIWAIVVWHNHNSCCIYRDVVVQVSDDPAFTQGVTTLFNNDQDNSSELGTGTDREYYETHEGLLVNAKGTQARYVRCSSNGSTDSALNLYAEMEVYALPVVTPAASPTPATQPEGARAGAGTQPAPLPLRLPAPAFKGTPPEPPADTTALKPTGKPRPPFYAPGGVLNFARGKKVTSSDKAPITGALDLITDGDNEATDTSTVELHRRTQWVQVDLEQSVPIYAIALWHNHNTPGIYRDVVVQVSNDPDFIQDVTTLFNNDQDNSSGLGLGTDREYFETNEGKLIDAKGTKARYVRCSSKGSTDSALNVYTEIEVYALPPAPAAAGAQAAPLPLKLPPPAFK